MPAAQLFFVYGTLRRGDDNDITLLKPAPKFLGQTSIAGTMYHFGGYPGVILGYEKSGHGQIVGEVYEVSPELEKVLDAIEAQYPVAPDYYIKRSITLSLQAGGAPVQAFVYEVNPVYTLGKPIIASGDWVKDR
ncbi:MAG: gamma-glutamylcyclotransferase [Burkholderiales bacterium]|nr:MAG: gamma-glutamylcyclotransferase [Burkholderiales bacterium]